MNVWRVQLKTEPGSEMIVRKDVLTFCQENQILGLGWYYISSKEDDWNSLHKEAHEKYPDHPTPAFKAVNAIRQMKTDDLIWTRAEGIYYLCRVGKNLWKDRQVTQRHIDHDLGNFVSVEWLEIGTEDKVPGKVVNSFRPSATAQRVVGVETVSKQLWNLNCPQNSPKYDVENLTMEDFWRSIGAENLEALVLLYLQAKGYYIYTSTLKPSTSKIECVLIKNDGSRRAYPQVKSGDVALDGKDYLSLLSNAQDIVYLFAESQNYARFEHPQVCCLAKSEIEQFVFEHRALLPQNISAWLDLVKGRLEDGTGK